MAIGCSPQIGDKALLLKTARTQPTELGEVQLVPILLTCVHSTGSSMRVTQGEVANTKPATNPLTYIGDLPENLRMQ